MTRSRWMLPASLAVACSLLACSSGLDDNNDTLPMPAIAAGAAAKACGTAGSTAITLAVVGTRVVEGVPTGSGGDVVQVPGQVASLGAGQSIYALVLDYSLNCPIGDWAEITPAADGSFVTALSIEGTREFRVVAVSGPSGATPACADTGDCVQLDSAGTISSVTGLSNAVGVRLDP